MDTNLIADVATRPVTGGEKIWTFINQNLPAELSAIAILALITWWWKWGKNWNDRRKIYRVLAQSKYEFLATHAISSKTKIAESRIPELMSNNRKFKRNELEKQSWRIDPEWKKHRT